LDQQYESPAEQLLCGATRSATIDFDEYKIARDGAHFTPLECTGASDKQDSELDQKLEIFGFGFCARTADFCAGIPEIVPELGNGAR